LFCFAYKKAVLSVTHTKWLHKLDFAQAEWPIVDFPKIKYPMEQYARENSVEEARCLSQVKRHAKITARPTLQ
jgi:4-aminobutyrate aminotransferase/(S)-3-amino-2-methylpropionate transaminase